MPQAMLQTLSHLCESFSGLCTQRWDCWVNEMGRFNFTSWGRMVGQAYFSISNTGGFLFFFTFSLWSNLVHINYLPPAPTGGWMHLIVFICISLIMNLGIFSYFSYSFVFPCHLYSAYSHPFPNFSSYWVTDFFLYVLDMSILDIKHIF